MKTFKTANGTELPILNLKGKDYLEVKYRLVWFRESHPLWAIETAVITVTDKSALMKATVRDDQGHIVAESHKFENAQGFPDFIEKAETGAIGRALALCGFGTQFAGDDLDEASRIVDSPTQPRSTSKTLLAAAGGPPGVSSGQMTSQAIPHPPKPLSVAPSQRVLLGREIMAEAKTLGITELELSEWAQSLCGKSDLKDMSIPEMATLLADIRRDAAAPRQILPVKTPKPATPQKSEPFL